MKNTLEIYRNNLPKLANDFIYYAQCNPNKYKVVTRINEGVTVKVYKKPFNTLIFQYDFDEMRPGRELKILRFANRKHEYEIYSWKDCSDYYVYDEDDVKVLEQTLKNGKYEREIVFSHHDFVRIYNYFLEDQGYYENENTLF